MLSVDAGDGAGDAGVGVLWCGAAAAEVSGGRIKAGVHRVDTGARPRATLWYEVCTRQQVPTRIRATGLHRQESLRDEDAASGGGGGGGDGGKGAAEAKPITIFVKTLTGKTITITHLTPADSVMALFYVLQDREGLPPAKTRAIVAGKILIQDDSIPLSAYGIRDRSTVHLILRLRSIRAPKDPKLEVARMRAELAGGGPADLAAAEAAMATSGMALESRLRNVAKKWRCVKCGGTTRVDDATGKHTKRIASCFDCGAWTCCACEFVNDGPGGEGVGEEEEVQCQMCRNDPYMQKAKEMGWTK